jgi:hypothetical protein
MPVNIEPLPRVDIAVPKYKNIQLNMFILKVPVAVIQEADEIDAM